MRASALPAPAQTIFSVMIIDFMVAVRWELSVN
jgi:hypothetical protein